MSANVPLTPTSTPGINVLTKEPAQAWVISNDGTLIAPVFPAPTTPLKGGMGTSSVIETSPTARRSYCGLSLQAAIVCAGTIQLPPSDPVFAQVATSPTGSFGCGIRLYNDTVQCWPAGNWAPGGDGSTMPAADSGTWTSVVLGNVNFGDLFSNSLYFCGIRTHGNITCLGQFIPSQAGAWSHIATAGGTVCATNSTGIYCWTRTIPLHLILLGSFHTVVMICDYVAGVKTPLACGIPATNATLLICDRNIAFQFPCSLYEATPVYAGGAPLKAIGVCAHDAQYTTPSATLGYYAPFVLSTIRVLAQPIGNDTACKMNSSATCATLAGALDAISRPRTQIHLADDQLHVFPTKTITFSDVSIMGFGATVHGNSTRLQIPWPNFSIQNTTLKGEITIVATFLPPVGFLSFSNLTVMDCTLFVERRTSADTTSVSVQADNYVQLSNARVVRSNLTLFVPIPSHVRVLNLEMTDTSTVWFHIETGLGYGVEIDRITISPTSRAKVEIMDRASLTISNSTFWNASIVATNVALVTWVSTNSSHTTTTIEACAAIEMSNSSNQCSVLHMRDAATRVYLAAVTNMETHMTVRNVARLSFGDVDFASNSGLVAINDLAPLSEFTVRDCAWEDVDEDALVVSDTLLAATVVEMLVQNANFRRVRGMTFNFRTVRVRLDHVTCVSCHGVVMDAPEIVLQNVDIHNSSAWDVRSTRARSLVQASDCVWTNNVLNGVFQFSATDVRMVRCACHDNVAAADGGGCLTARDGARLEIQDSTFANNRVTPAINNGVFSGKGGAIQAVSSSLNFTHTAFWNNSADQDGGAVFVSVQSNLHLAHCVLSANRAIRGNGGAVSVGLQTVTTATNTTMTNNSAFGFGGALFCDQSSILVDGSKFAFGTASGGGAICVQAGSRMQAARTDFVSNTAVVHGGALFVRDSSTMVISQPVLCTRNHAESGGCLYAELFVETESIEFRTGNRADFGANVAGPGVRLLLHTTVTERVEIAPRTAPAIELAVIDQWNQTANSDTLVSVGPFALLGSDSLSTQRAVRGRVMFDRLQLRRVNKTQLLVFTSADIMAETKLEVEMGECPPSRALDTLSYECRLCASGRFSNASSLSSACRMCESGRFASSAGASACESCPIGYHSSEFGSSICAACASGRFAAHVGATGCSECDMGFYRFESAGTNCTECPAGRYTDTLASVQCRECGAGTYSANSSNTQCVMCAAGTMSDITGRSACTQCGANTYQYATGATFCSSCGGNRYYSGDVANPCIECPLGTVCLPEGVVARQGFMTAIENGRVAAYACQPASACLSGDQCITTNATTKSCCGTGRLPASQNPFCARCLEGYSQQNDECVPCTEANGGVVFAILLLAIAWVLVSHRLAQNTNADTRILITFTQLVVLYVPRHGGFSALRFVSFDVMMTVGATCVVPLSDRERLVADLVVPILCFGVFLFLAAVHAGMTWVANRTACTYCKRIVDGNKKWRTSPYRRTLLYLCLFMHTTLTRSTISFWNCTHFGTDSYVAAYRGISCASAEYKSLVPLFIVLAIVLTLAPVGLLVFVSWIAWNGRLHDAKTVERSGVLFELYNDSVFFWEVVVVARRVVTTAVINLVHDPTVAFKTLSLFNLAALIGHSSVGPFRHGIDNAFEAGAQVVLVIVTVISIGATDPYSASQVAAVATIVYLACFSLLARVVYNRIRISRHAPLPTSPTALPLSNLVTSPKSLEMDSKTSSI